MNITGQATIFKDDKGVYRLSIMNKEIQENGEEQNVFMRINVGFKKGVEVKNKTKINITNGFLTFFRIPTGNTYENGSAEYKKYPKIIVLDFEVLEEGIDEVQQTRDYSAPTTKEVGYADTQDEFWSTDDEELPF